MAGEVPRGGLEAYDNWNVFGSLQGSCHQALPLAGTDSGGCISLRSLKFLSPHCLRHEHTQAAIHLQEGGVLTMYEVPRLGRGVWTLSTGMAWPWWACLRGDSQSTKPSTSTPARQVTGGSFQLLIVAQQHSHYACGLMSGSSHHAVPPIPHAYQSAAGSSRPARNAGVSSLGWETLQRRMYVSVFICFSIYICILYVMYSMLYRQPSLLVCGGNVDIHLFMKSNDCCLMLCRASLELPQNIHSL